MTTLCITGATQSDLDPVANILQRAGMQSAKPSSRGEAIDMTYWHGQVVPAPVNGHDSLQAVASVGKLWEQLASDIFLSNMESPLWGWADARSTWLLDYWLAFEPGLKLVLVCVSRQQMLANAMANGSDIASVEAMLLDWKVHHQELLRFHRQNPKRSLLVDAHDCAANPGALIEQCAGRWKLPLAKSSEANPARPGQDQLVLYIAQQLCREHPQTAVLQDELAGAITRMGGLDVRANTTTLGRWGAMLAQVGKPKKAVSLYALQPEDIIAGYRALRDRSAELGQVQAAQEEVSALKARIDDAAASQRAQQIKLEVATGDSNLLLLQQHQLQEKFEQELARNESAQAQIAALQGEIKKLTKARDDQTKLATEGKARIDALTKERDSHAKQSTERQTQIDALTKTNATLTKARDDQTKLATEGKVRIDALTKERDSHAKQHKESEAKLKDATEEGELLLAQLHQVQEELEAIFLKNESAQQEIAALKKARDEQAKLAAERQAKIDQLSKTQAPVENKAQAEALKAANAKLQDAEQARELLALQLDQVQEELERYVLKHQGAQTDLKTAEERWQRILKRNPDYYDYDAIEILQAEGKKGAATTWRIKNLSAAGRNLPELEFKTIVEHDTAGLVFSRPAGTAGPLTRWPANSASESELTLIPVGSGASVQQRAEALLDLATQDWDFVRALMRLLRSALETPGAVKAPKDFKPEALRSGLDRLGQIVEKFPAVLRYDRVSLKREQINPDYEHLWLRFENLAFGGKRWPEFEFRLSCANVRPKQFGTHPKLEFPEETSQAPFEAWFIEAYDDFGAKLELRFTLPQSMDLGVWERLSENDRAFLSALIKRLPAILGALQSAGVKIKRPWEEWSKLALDLQRITQSILARPNAPTREATDEAAATLPSASPQRSSALPLALVPSGKPLAKVIANSAKVKPAIANPARPARARKTK